MLSLFGRLSIEDCVSDLYEYRELLKNISGEHLILNSLIKAEIGCIEVHQWLL